MRQPFLIRHFHDDNIATEQINDLAQKGYEVVSITGSSIRVYDSNKRREGVEHGLWVFLRYTGDPKVQEMAQRLRAAGQGGYE